MRFRPAAILTTMAVSLGLSLPAMAAPDGTAYHLYRPNFHPAPSSTPPPAATMLYYGGPVIANVKIVAVMWGPTVRKTTSRGLSAYFKAMVNSTYIDQLSQYSTVGITGVNGKPGTNQTITRGTYTGKFVISPANTAKTLTDAQVQAEIKAQITGGHLPAADLNTLYMIYFPSGITITLGGSRSCLSFGAYHEAVSSTVTPNNIFYGVMPDCGGGFTSVTDVSSHEFAEAISDAIPTPGSHPAFPQAWNDANGNEIGDLCQGHNATLTAAGQTYTVQEIFTNSTNACATGNFTSP